MTRDEKLDFVNYLIFLRGKLQALSIRLILEGQDHTRVDEAEEKLADVIRRLRVEIMREWQGDATEVMTRLRALNKKAQQKVRELEDTIEKAEKVAEIIEVIDSGLQAVTRLVTPVG